MSASKFSITPEYRPRGGDLVLLISLGRSRLFDAGALPAELRKLQTAVKAGRTETVYAGKAGRSTVRVDAACIESKDRPAEDGVKAAVSHAVERAGEGGLGRVVVVLDGGRGSEFARAAHEGAALGAYLFARRRGREPYVPPVEAGTKKPPKEAGEESS